MFAGEQNSKEFRKINPMRQIPVIKHGDFILCESHAIMRYLAQAFPCDEHWYPKDLKTRSI